MADCWNTDTGEAVFRTRDVLVVGWQEKLFSQYEMELFQNEAACQTPLDRQYHTEVKALNKAKGRRNHRIFTYTDHDRYTNSLPFQQLNSTELLTTTKSVPTFLAERMANVRHRRQDRRTMDCSVPTSKIINWEPTEEFVKNYNTKIMDVMCCMPLDKKGISSVCVLLCRIVTGGEKKDVWRLTLENVSTAMKPEEKEREQSMYKDLYVRHKEYLNSLVGQDFEMVSRKSAVITTVYISKMPIIQFPFTSFYPVSAKGFEYDNLYIHFFMELPNNWSSLPFQSLSGVTQTCRTKTLGKEDVAFFSYPFSFEAFYMCEKESEESVPQWPVLYFKVLSLDSWQRYRTEGYGYLLFPAIPGKHTVTCHTWRPLQTGTVSALRRFFIGGSPELEDHSYVRIPGTFKGERLSRFGFCTETTGSVTFNLHCIQQARAFVDANMLKKRRQKVFDQLGGFSQQGAVCTILEAFQRARRKMQEAREALPRDLINATSELQIESSA
uniref:MKS transition zone complex subunit 1 n=1 Tax=Sparus aurata TaxID=8175 RepID=A0A671WID4_SPAAU